MLQTAKRTAQLEAIIRQYEVSTEESHALSLVQKEDILPR
jgi:hypothetical protein